VAGGGEGGGGGFAGHSRHCSTAAAFPEWPESNKKGASEGGIFSPPLHIPFFSVGLESIAGSSGSSGPSAALAGGIKIPLAAA